MILPGQSGSKSLIIVKIYIPCVCGNAGMGCHTPERCGFSLSNIESLVELHQVINTLPIFELNQIVIAHFFMIVPQQGQSGIVRTIGYAIIPRLFPLREL